MQRLLGQGGQHQRFESPIKQLVVNIIHTFMIYRLTIYHQDEKSGARVFLLTSIPETHILPRDN